MGRRRRPWTSYRATRTEGVLGAHLPLRWVTIESGERLGRFQTIPGFALPDTPQKTAQSIAAIAARQQWVAARVAEMAVADRPGRRLRGGESPPEFGRKRPAGFGGGPFTRRRSL